MGPTKEIMLTLFILCTLIIFFKRGVAGDLDTAIYDEDFKLWTKAYSHSAMYCYDCLTTASEKFIAVAKVDDRFADEKYRNPIIVVNLFSQERPKIYEHVNKYLYHGRVGESIWESYAGLLGRAIDILSPLASGGNQNFTVYRGQGCERNIPAAGKTFRLNRFFSTSLNPNVALSFMNQKDCKLFLKINNAKGLPMMAFSQYEEQELLLKSDTVFFVKKFFDSLTTPSAREDIAKEMKNLENSRIIMPDIYVHLTMTENAYKKRLRRATSYHQRKNRLL